MFGKRWLGLALLAVVGTILAAVIFWRGNSGREPVVDLGAVLPLTGPGAPFGESSRNALLLATDEINALTTGPHFQLHIEDGMTDPRSSVSAFVRLRDLRHARLFITTVSSVSLALAPLADEKQALLFANASHPQVTENRQFVFRYSPTAESEAAVVFQFVVDRHWARTYVIALNDDYGRAYVSALDQARTANPQITFAGVDFYDRALTDFRTVATKAIGAAPDSLILIGFGRSLGLLIRELRELGYTGPFVASLGIIATPDALTSAGEAIRGGYYVNLELARSHTANEFRRKYRERFGSEPNPTALIDYGTVHILAQGIEAVGPDPRKLADFYHGSRTLQLPTGKVTVSPSGDVIPPVFVSPIPQSGPVDLWE